MKKATVILRPAQSESSAGDELCAIGTTEVTCSTEYIALSKLPGFMLLVYKKYSPESESLL